MMFRKSGMGLLITDTSAHLSSLKAEDLEPLLSSPEERAPSDLRVLTPLSDLQSSSILKFA